MEMEASSGVASWPLLSPLIVSECGKRVEWHETSGCSRVCSVGVCVYVTGEQMMAACIWLGLGCVTAVIVRRERQDLAKEASKQADNDAPHETRIDESTLNFPQLSR